MKPIAVVGSYNVGLTIRANRIPATGETVLGEGYCEGPGGKGSNQAIAASRLGAKVRFVGCVGKDRYGDEALSLWKAEGVSTESVRRVDLHSGIAFIVVNEIGSNAITVDPGANSRLSPEDVIGASGQIDGCRILLTQLEIPSETAATAAIIAKKSGATTILNPAPARKSSALDLSNFDIITPNETELSVLTGTTDVEAGSRTLLSRGPKAVVVTLGGKGACVVTEAGASMVPAPRVTPVDTTGAGDAFNGALAVAISEDEPLSAAVRFANYAGALAVTKKEVIPALPTRRELEEFRRNDVLE